MARFDLNNYKDVQQRIVEFWTKYPDGRLETELMSLPDEFERVVFRARAWKQAVPFDAPADVTGWAAETAGTAGANQTSWHENCETSAIGRALANLGFAKTLEDRPSRQEMEKVNRGQDTQPNRPQPRDPAPAPARGPVTQPQGVQTSGITPEQMQAITNMAVELGVPVGARVKADFQKESLAMLSQGEGAKLVQDLSEEQRVHRAAKREEERKQKELEGAQRGQSAHFAP